MGVIKAFKAAAKVVKAAQADVDKPKAKVVKLSDHKKNAGKK